MANKRWMNNPLLTTYDGVSIPVTGKDGVDYQMGNTQLAEAALKGNPASGKIATVNSTVAKADVAKYVSTDSGMKIYAEGNSVNFGGNQKVGIVVFGDTAKDLRPIPSAYSFGYGKEGEATAELRAKKFIQDGKDVANIENVLFSTSFMNIKDGVDWNTYTTPGKYIGNSISINESLHIPTGLAKYFINLLVIPMRSTGYGESYMQIAYNIGLNENEISKIFIRQTYTDSSVQANKWTKWSTLATTSLIANAQRIGLGRNIVELLGASSVQDAFNKIHAMNGDYGILQLGDYIDLPTFTVPGVGEIPAPRNRVEICGFNHYDKTGATPQLGVLFQWKNVAFLHGMNTDHINKGGYYDCNLRKILNGDFATALGTVVGAGNLRAVKRLAEKHDPTNWWTNWVEEKAFLPTEVEVWGHQIWGNAGYSTGTSIQWPIFALDPSRRCKLYNGGYQYWWTATSCVKGDNEQPNLTHFSSVRDYGNAGYSSAGLANGVAPAFYI